MLSDNPDLRPQSMGEVAASISRLDDKAVQAVVDGTSETSRGTTRALLRRINIRMGVLALILMLMIAAGGGASGGISPSNAETANRP